MSFIIAKCSKCKKTFQMDEDLYLYRKKHQSRINCPECLQKSKEKRYKKVREAIKATWNNYSESERLERVKKAKLGIANMSLEAKNKRSMNSSIAAKNQMANRTPEEIEITKKKISEYNKIRYLNMTDEERKNLSEKISKGLNNRSDKDKFISNLKRSNTLKATIATMSPKEKAIRIKRLKDYWNNIDIETFQKIKKDQAIKYSNYINNISINPNLNELNLMIYLDKYNIKYKYQSFNTIIHPDFSKLFPINPITGSNYVNPHHKWDFRLFTKDSEVLIDIDGSIHAHPSYSITHPFTKIRYQLLDYYKFKDSQRPYQTDNLPAYVILCYDNNLTDDTLVIDLITNSTIDFKTFLSILICMNLDKK